MTETVIGLLFVLVLGGLLVGFFLWLQLGNRQRPPLRAIPAYQELPARVGMAVESGKRLHISLGREGVLYPSGAVTLAGLTVLDLLTEAAAISDQPPTVSAGEATAVILAQDTLRRVYQRQNTMDRYEHTSAELTGGSAWSYAAGVGAVQKTDDVAALVVLGQVSEETALIADGADRQRAYSVIGAGDLRGQAVAYVLASQPLLGEDIFAGGAYVRGGRLAHVGSLMAQDVIRVLLAAVLLIGGLLGVVVGSLR